jgi:hypothetical protein
MFLEDDKFKPISIIITTLAARAYNGETNMNEALINILQKMPDLINNTGIRVPNPTMPTEDFAHKWQDETKLEKSFKSWLAKAESDFEYLINNKNNSAIIDASKETFGVPIDENKLPKRIYQSAPKTINLNDIQIRPHKW